MGIEPRPSSLSRLSSRAFVPHLWLLVSLQLLNQALQAEPPSGRPQSGPTLPGIFISARSLQGAPAKLAASDLEVKINGKPASVRDVQLLGRPALRYCLLFDRSGSQRRRWQQHLDEASLLLRTVQAGRDYGLLTAFNDHAYLDAEGPDPQKLIKALSNVDARSSTALYDAVIACSDSLADSASPSELRVMFILSDGDDNDSHHSRDQALQSLVRLGVRVYAIGQRNTEDPAWQHTAAQGIDALKQFTEKTGGKAYLSKSDNDLQAVLNDIFSQLSSVVSVSLSSTLPLPGDLVHKVEFRCKERHTLLNAPQEIFVPLH